MTDVEYARKYLASEASATHRGIEFSLSFGEYKKLYNRKKCYYTGKKLKHKDNFSLDRIDNTKGYVPGNVVPCDKVINGLKNNLTIEQIKLLYVGILKHEAKLKK